MPVARPSMFPLFLPFTSLAAALLLSACGGGSSSSSIPTIEVSGSVFAAAVNGASVNVTDLAGNQLAGPASTNASGRFTLSLPQANLDDVLVFTASGGTFTDEASAENTNNTSMKGIVAAASLAQDGSVDLNISPESTLIHRLVDQYGLPLNEAHARFEQAFGYAFDPHILPVDASVFNSTATDAQRLAGLRAAAFSQLTQDLGLAPGEQFALLSLLADDLADGELDGLSENEPLTIANVSLDAGIQTRFAEALIGFKASARHNSGLSDDQLGQLPFTRVAVTDSYEVTYLPHAMAASAGQEQQGKSSFTLRITDLNDQAQSGLAPTLSAIMYMQSHQHSTPSISITEDPEQAGYYLVTVYYLMPSLMMNGTSMGYWKLVVDIAGEQATFFPRVGMAMGSDTVRANLKGQDDLAPNMMGSEESRPYYLFRHAINHVQDSTNFKVFIATRENMMRFPFLETGLTLNAGLAQELSINDIRVRMSSDEQSWAAAVYEQNGLWSADLTGLTPGETASIYVELTVNAEQKTDDGTAPDGTADNAMFTVTVPSPNLM